MVGPSAVVLKECSRRGKCHGVKIKTWSRRRRAGAVRKQEEAQEEANIHASLRGTSTSTDATHRPEAWTGCLLSAISTRSSVFLVDTGR